MPCMRKPMDSCSKRLSSVSTHLTLRTPPSAVSSVIWFSSTKPKRSTRKPCPVGSVPWTSMRKHVALTTLKPPSPSITWQTSTTLKGSTSKPNHSSSVRWRSKSKCSSLITLKPPGRTLGNLANVYYSQGKYEQAEPLYQRSLAIFEEVLSLDHPDVGIALNNLANVY